MHQVQQSCDSYELNINIKETKRVINQSSENLRLKSKYHSLLMGELLSNISLFVGQLYADKSLALRARDLFCFTTYLQTVIYCSTIHSFLIKDALSLNIYSQVGLVIHNGQVFESCLVW